MFRFAALLVAAAAVCSSAQTDCPGVPNTIPIYDGEPVPVANTTNGALFHSGPPQLYPKLNVLHLYGSGYEMGFAYGTLMRDDIVTLMNETLGWIDAKIDGFIDKLPEPVQKWINTQGVEIALNLTLEWTTPHIPQHYFDLSYGLGNATGLGWHKIMTISLFPELVKASCSMLGAWGSATAGSDMGLVQLRALDWSTDSPLQQYPVLVTYHPTDGHAHTVLGWAGLLGALTGMSSSGMGVSEKVWDHYTGVQNVEGYPFMFLMQDVLWEDSDTDQALSRVATANRTCAIFLGIGDKGNTQFRALEYSYQTVNIYNAKNFPAYPPYHPLFNDLVFIDKHTQPSNHMCFGSLMTKYYGQLSPSNIIKYVTAQQQTGNTHAAVYDFKNSAMYVANASPYTKNGTVINSYEGQWIKMDMAQQWTLPAPTA